jgi:hypothetical protein
MHATNVVFKMHSQAGAEHPKDLDAEVRGCPNLDHI